MSAKMFYAVAIVGLVVIVAGLLFFNPPQPDNVEIRSLEEFYQSQYLVAAASGIATGVVLGLLARAGVYHRPDETGDQYNRRVVSRGILAGGVAMAVAFVLACAFAVGWTLEPLAPLERVTLVVASGLFLVVLAIAGVAALAAYTVVTRAAAWGGQYAILPRL